MHGGDTRQILTPLPHRCIYELAEVERHTLRVTLDGLRPYYDRPLDDLDLQLMLRRAGAKQSDPLCHLLLQFGLCSNDCGALLIRTGLVDPNLPPTPPDGRPSLLKRTRDTEYSLLLMGTQTGGYPIAFADEKAGAVIQNICPVQGQEDKQENTGAGFLELHTEDAFHPYSPDLLALYCLRPDHDRMAQTGVASIRRALPFLTAATLKQLFKPEYRIRLSDSFRAAPNAPLLYSEPMPVLSGDPRSPTMAFDAYGMEALTIGARIALEELTYVMTLPEVMVGGVLLPGDMLIIDNRIAAHARTPFRPRYTGDDRWLQRLFLTRDLQRSALSRRPNSCVCVPLPLEFAVR